MGRNNKKRTSFLKNLTIGRDAFKRKKQRLEDWNNVYESNTKYLDLMHNAKGRVRPCEENMMLLQALFGQLRMYIGLAKNNNVDVDDANWRLLEDNVKKDFGVNGDYLKQLKKTFTEENGAVLMFGDEEKCGRCPKPMCGCKLTKD